MCARHQNFSKTSTPQFCLGLIWGIRVHMKRKTTQWTLLPLFIAQVFECNSILILHESWMFLLNQKLSLIVMCLAYHEEIGNMNIRAFQNENKLGCARFADIFTFSSGAPTNLSTRHELHDSTMKGLCETNEHLLCKSWQCVRATKIAAKRAHPWIGHFRGLPRYYPFHVFLVSALNLFWHYRLQILRHNNENIHAFMQMLPVVRFEFKSLPIELSWEVSVRRFLNWLFLKHNLSI